MDDFTTPDAIVVAADLPGAQLFVFPPSGQVEAVLVLAPDRFVWELRSDNAAAWFEACAFTGIGGPVSLEAALAHWCSWVPRLYRPIVLGIQSAEDLTAPRH